MSKRLKLFFFEAHRAGNATCMTSMTGIAMALKDCPDEEDLNILTDSLSAMVLLRSMQRRVLPLWLHLGVRPTKISLDILRYPEIS